MDFLSDQECSEDYWPPICGQEGRLGSLQKPVDVSEAEDSALGWELSALLDRTDEFSHIIQCRSLPER